MANNSTHVGTMPVYSKYPAFRRVPHASVNTGLDDESSVDMVRSIMSKYQQIGWLLSLL